LTSQEDEERVTDMWAEKNTHRILVKTSEIKRPLGRTRRRWDYNIKIGGREIEFGVMDFPDLAENRDQ
jgi:hypothetical protein